MSWQRRQRQQGRQLGGAAGVKQRGEQSAGEAGLHVFPQLRVCTFSSAALPLTESRVSVLPADARSPGGIWGAAAGPAIAAPLDKYEMEKLASAVGSGRVEVA